MKRLVLSIFTAALAVSFNACERQKTADTLPSYYQEGSAHGAAKPHAANAEHPKAGDPAKKAEPQK